MITFFCYVFGTFLTAKPMTMALSPAKTKSITIIDKRAEKTQLKKVQNITPYFDNSPYS